MQDTSCLARLRLQVVDWSYQLRVRHLEAPFQLCHKPGPHAGQRLLVCSFIPDPILLLSDSVLVGHIAAGKTMPAFPLGQTLE